MMHLSSPAAHTLRGVGRRALCHFFSPFPSNSHILKHISKDTGKIIVAKASETPLLDNGFDFIVTAMDVLAGNSTCRWST
jgi:hypothetical protein